MSICYSRDCRADLHSHSSASDGRLSPTALVERALGHGVELLALTDHDTLDGLAEAGLAARTAKLAFVPGVELSTSWQNKTLHIVGLGIATDSPELRHGLKDLQQRRDERARRIAERLEKLGAHDALAKVRGRAGGGQITRTHFARMLVEQGLAADLKQAFRRYLAAGKPAHVNARWVDMDAAIGWIHAAGGLAVLAHPLRYGLSGAWRERLFQAFSAAGGDALEVSCGASQQAADLALLTRAALKHQLLASVGSDFHGPEQRWLQLGRLAPLSTQLTPVWTRLPRQH